jgi:endonuclease/exonuclease/phosphatase family metal-dependent hydrolase
VDEVQYIAEKCGYPYVAVAYTWNRYYIPFPFTIDVRRHFGKVLAAQATFSKYPLHSQVVLPLPQVLSKPWWYRFFYLHQVMQVVTVHVGDKQLDVANIHLEAFDKPTRQRQADYVVTELEDVFSKLPLILAGDFNALKTDKESLVFEDDPKVDYGSDRTLSFFKNTSFLKCSAPDLGGTFPSNKPDRLLDYIFYNPKFFEPVKALRCDDAQTASDHLPVFAEFKLNI